MIKDSGEANASQKTKAQKMSEYYSQHVVEIDEVDSCLEEGSTQNFAGQASQKLNYSCDF